MNQVIFMGRLTADVNLEYTNGGMAVAHFNLALNRGKDNNGNDKGTDFPNIVAFGRTAENIERFSGKGLRLIVYGRVQTGKYESRETGKNVYTTDFIADRVEFIDWKQKDGENGKQAASDGIPDGFRQSADDTPF